MPPAGRLARSFLLLVVTSVGLLHLPASPAEANGVENPHQGARAAGTAGAFVARADDPTTVFHNPGGVALADQWKAVAGLSYDAVNERLYQGLGPALGTTGTQRDIGNLPPHLAYVQPLTKRLKLGVALHTRYLLETTWDDPDSYPGRAVTTSAELTTYDLDVVASYKAADTLGIGVGVTWRSSELQLARRVQTTDPTTGTTVDFGALATDTDLEGALGFSVGFLHRPSPRFAWGASYRSAIDTDYTATGTLTQVSTGNTQLDDLLAATQPFGLELPAATSLKLPATARIGVAIGLGEQFLVALDVEQASWSGLDALSLTYPSDTSLDQTIDLALEDAMSIRVGFQYTTLGGIELRLGYAREESPLPDSTVGALWSDGDHNIYAAGVGLDWLHVAFQWIDQEQRVVVDQVDDLDGNYRGNGWRAVLSVHM